MKRIIILSVICLLALQSNKAFAKKPDTEKAKKEILATETAFAKMVKEKGIKEAFLYYAADSAVLMRDKLVKGKAEIKAYFDKQKVLGELSWTPEFVSVAESCDMGYTYGHYDFSAMDNGKPVSRHGLFHTIWQKQKDGSWKFIFD